MNASLTAGGRHAWIYDVRTVAQLFEHAGFATAVRMTATISGREASPFPPLGLDEEGCPRADTESMYIEARKP